jgi:hypothetical protein
VANGANGVGYGGGFYSTSASPGLRYLISLTFESNVASSGKGNDIADASSSVFDHYSQAGVIGCASSSGIIKFYSIYNNISMDCLLDNNCPADYFYVSNSGTDFSFCGDAGSPCLSLVKAFSYFFNFFLFFF